MPELIVIPNVKFPGSNLSFDNNKLWRSRSGLYLLSPIAPVFEQPKPQKESYDNRRSPAPLHVNPRKCLRDYRDEYIAYLKKYELKSPGTIRDEYYSLYGRFIGTDIFSEAEKVGIFYPEDVTMDRLWELYLSVKAIIKKVNYRTRKIGTFRHFLEYLMNNGVVRNDKSILKVLKTARWLPAKPELPSETQLRVLEEWGFSELSFVNYRDTLMIHVLVGICGLRPGKEVVRIKVSKIKLRDCEITFLRKSGKRKTVKFPVWVRPYLQAYLKMRKELLGEDATTVDDLFIKIDPHMGCKKNNPSWQLCASGFWLRIRELKKKFPVLEGMKPYFLRHWAITVYVANAREEGVSMDEVAYSMDNSPRVCMTFYNGKILALNELLHRPPKEKVEFLKDLIRRSLIKYLEHPEKPEYRESIIEWKRRLGRTQSGIELAEYESLNNSEESNVDKKEINCENIQKLYASTHNLPPWVLGDKLLLDIIPYFPEFLQIASDFQSSKCMKPQLS